MPYPSTGNITNDATGYITGVINALNTNNGKGINGSTDTFGGLNETEDNSALAIIAEKTGRSRQPGLSHA